MDNVIPKTTIDILQYVLTGKKTEVSADIDFSKLFDFAKSHGVENMVYVGLCDLNIAVSQEVMGKFKQAYEMQIMVEAVQAIELENIGAAFEEAGIDFIPLKGSIVKYLYPMPDYRKCTDIDILIKPENEEVVQSIMYNLGYIAEDDTSQIHISYMKKPYIEIEVHRQLTHKADRAYKFCMSVWDYATLKDEKKHEYLMSNEFLYVHTLAHFCRHLYFGGAGIRLITDIYVLLQNCRFNKGVLRKFIKIANLEVLDSLTTALAQKWFGNGCSTDNNVERLADIVMRSGSYGTVESKRIIRNSESKGRKAVNLIKELFPSYEVLRWRYNCLQGRPYMLPAIWVYRFFSTVMHKREKISEKLGQSFDNSKKYSDMDVILEAIRDIR